MWNKLDEVRNMFKIILEGPAEFQQIKVAWRKGRKG